MFTTLFTARCFAERGYEIACRLSDRLSVCLSVTFKTITMKITIFIIVILKSNETWKFDIPDCHSLLTVQNPAKTVYLKTCLQISLTVSSFQFFSGYFAAIARYPRPCSRNVWILNLSSTETLPMTPEINYKRVY